MDDPATTTNRDAHGDEGSLEGTCSESDIDTPYDTIGLRFDDRPTSGGVAGDESKSAGGVSEITAPLYYIPTPSISVPQEMMLSETTIEANSTPHANLLAGLKAADHPGQYVNAAEYLALGRKQIGPRGWERPTNRYFYSCTAKALVWRIGLVIPIQ